MLVSIRNGECALIYGGHMVQDNKLIIISRDGSMKVTAAIYENKEKAIAIGNEMMNRNKYSTNDNDIYYIPMK